MLLVGLAVAVPARLLATNTDSAHTAFAQIALSPDAGREVGPITPTTLILAANPRTGEPPPTGGSGRPQDNIILAVPLSIPDVFEGVGGRDGGVRSREADREAATPGSAPAAPTASTGSDREAPTPALQAITLTALDVFAAQAGWDISSQDWASMRRIISECEDPSLLLTSANLNDPYGGSHGLAQLNYNWFAKAGEDPDQRYDPVVNLRTALWLYNRLGRFGGGGGWSCAGILGIY